MSGQSTFAVIFSNHETVKRYFHFDGLGNTLCLTDTSETTQDSYAYTAFGLPLSSSGSSVNPYRYVGQWGYYDDGAMGSPHDFILCGVRYFAPRFGRFLTWDPIGARGYGYCGNSATMATDPSGRVQRDFKFGGGLEGIINPPRVIPPRPRPGPKPVPKPQPVIVPPVVGAISDDFPWGNLMDPGNALCEGACSDSKPPGVFAGAHEKWCKTMCNKIRQGGCKMLEGYCDTLCGSGQKWACESCLAFYDASGCPGSIT